MAGSPLIGYSTDAQQPGTTATFYGEILDARGTAPEQFIPTTAAAAQKPRSLKWLAWTLPTVALLVLAVVVGSTTSTVTRGSDDGPGSSAPGGAASVPTPISTPTPTPTPTRPPLPRTNGSAKPGTVTGGLSSDETYSEYRGTGNVDVSIAKLSSGPNLITFDYRGSGTFKAAQLNAEEENTGTLVNVKGGNHTGRYLLDLWQADGESKAIRIKSSGGAWKFKIQHVNDVREISDVKTYEAKGNDVLYYPFNVRTDFGLRHPSDGPFKVKVLSDGKLDTIISDENEEFLTYSMYIKSPMFVIVESDGAWSMNPK